MSPKMKYAGLFSILFIYLFSVCGITINKHFCGGELESVTLIEKGSCCEGEEAGEADDCCADETIYMSAASDVILSSEKIAFYKTQFSFPFNNAVFHSLSKLQAKNYISTVVNYKPPNLCAPNLSSLMVFKI